MTKAERAQHWRNYMRHRHLSIEAKGWLCYAAWKQGTPTRLLAWRYGVSEGSIRAWCKAVGRPLGKYKQAAG